MTVIDETIKALTAISDGYTVFPSEGYVVVKNPDFEEDNGSNPNLVIDIQEISYLLKGLTK